MELNCENKIPICQNNSFSVLSNKKIMTNITEYSIVKLRHIPKFTDEMPKA